jgi:hypothetical protein
MLLKPKSFSIVAGVGAMRPEIKTVGTVLGVAVSLGSGAAMFFFPNQQFVASIVLSASILLSIICIG